MDNQKSDEKNIIKSRKRKSKRIDAFGMFKGAPSFTRDDKIDSDF